MVTCIIGSFRPSSRSFENHLEGKQRQLKKKKIFTFPLYTIQRKQTNKYQNIFVGAGDYQE